MYQKAGVVEYTDLHLWWGIRPPNECSGHDIKKSDDEPPALKILRMQSTSSLLLTPGPLWPGVVAPDRFIYGSNLLFHDLNWVQTDDWCLTELLVIHSNSWNHLTLLIHAKLNC